MRRTGSALVLMLVSLACSNDSVDRMPTEAQLPVVLASEMMNPAVMYDPSWNETYDLPQSLQNKDAIILYLLNKGVGFDDEVETGAYRHLGFWFHTRDCRLAVYYYKEHLKAVPSDVDSARFVERLETELCPPIDQDDTGSDTGLPIPGNDDPN